jgi:hypothetical protein
MLFNFTLKPTERCDAIGRPSDLIMHWYGLTDGAFFLRIGEQELFRYSRAFLWRKAVRPWPEEPSIPYPNYQVAAFHRHVLEIFPSVALPVPRPVIEYVATAERQKAWEERCANWLDARYPEGAEPRNPSFVADFGVYERATGWWGCRQFSANWLRYAPDIRFWREGDNVNVRWDGRVVSDEGVPVWDSEFGQHTLPWQWFLEELVRFHERLMKQMRIRVRAASERWPRTDVRLDAARLLEEHLSQEQTLCTALRRVGEEPDWQAVLEANRLIEQS